MALGQSLEINKQQPGHHALDVLQIQRQRIAQAHAALYPGGVQMQKTAHAIFGKMHFGQMIGSGMGGHGKQKKASVKTMHCALLAHRLRAAVLAGIPCVRQMRAEPLQCCLHSTAVA